MSDISINLLISCRHINRGLEDSISLLELQPRFKTQEENFDLVLHCWLHLCYLLITLGTTYQVYLIQGGVDIGHECQQFLLQTNMLDPHETAVMLTTLFLQFL